MTPARAERLVRELTNVQSKVFYAVPVREAWADHVIMQELRRKGSNLAMDIIRGCLETLRRQGLIRETDPRHFQQINHHERAPSEPPKEQPAMNVHPEKTTTTHRPAADMATTLGLVKPKLSALERIARAAESLRKLVDELEDIALMVEEDLQAAGKDSEDLKQLRTLLAGFAAPRS